MQQLIFKYEEENQLNDLTTIEINGEIWFLAADVCRLLDIQNVPREVASLDDDEKLLYDFRIAGGQSRKMNFVNESGLYALIFRSNKPSAKRFRKWITKDVIPSIRKTGGYGINRLETPNFVIRFNDNWDRVDSGYFSVIGELFIILYGQFEMIGYKIPNKALDDAEIMPDISVGKMFSAYLKKNYPEKADSFKTYKHLFKNRGIEVDARQYVLDLLPTFRRFVNDKWMWECAENYFKKRDPIALNYLPKLLSKGAGDDEKKNLNDNISFGDAISKIAKAGKPKEQ